MFETRSERFCADQMAERGFHCTGRDEHEEKREQEGEIDCYRHRQREAPRASRREGKLGHVIITVPLFLRVLNMGHALKSTTLTGFMFSHLKNNHPFSMVFA